MLSTGKMRLLISSLLSVWIQGTAGLIRKSVRSGPALLGLLGAGVGGLGGAAYGALAPGEDAEGKKRNRWLNALGMGLLGAGVGGGAGMGGGALAQLLGGGRAEGSELFGGLTNTSEFDTQPISDAAVDESHKNSTKSVGDFVGRSLKNLFGSGPRGPSVDPDTLGPQDPDLAAAIAATASGNNNDSRGQDFDPFVSVMPPNYDNPLAARNVSDKRMRDQFSGLPPSTAPISIDDTFPRNVDFSGYPTP